MKTRNFFISISIFISLLHITSCSDKSVSSALKEAESLMNTHPDSAFVVLQSLESKKFSAKQKAHWCLLTTKAMDKNYMEHTSDSLIAIAVDYYEQTKEEEQLMEAYYYKGRVSHDLNNALKAQDYYLKGYEVGENSENHALLFRLTNNLGDLYLYQGNYEKTVDLFKVALEYLEKSGETQFKLKVLRNMARAYATLEEPDSSLIYYKMALANAVNRSDSIHCFSEMSASYQMKNDYPQAFKHTSKAMELIPDSLEERYHTVHYTHGKASFNMGFRDMAAANLKKALNSENEATRAGAHDYLYKHAEAIGNIHEALENLKAAYDLRTVVYEKKNTHSLRIQQTLFDRQQAENDKNKLEKAHLESEANRYKWMLLAAISLIGIITLSSLLYFLSHKFVRYRKVNELKTRENQIKIDFLSSLSDKYTKEINSLVASSTEDQRKIEELSNLIAGNKKETKVLEAENAAFRRAQEKRNSSPDALKNTEIYKKINTIIRTADASAVKFSDADKEALINTVEKLHPDFGLRIMQKNPAVTESDLLLCYLHKIDITSLKDLAGLLNLSKSGTSDKRISLSSKLGLEGNSKAFNEFIKSL